MSFHVQATQESIRDAIESQPIEEQREYILGYDSLGNTYMHFPQFCGADLRVYKQAPFPHPKMDPVTEPPSPAPTVAPSSPGKRKVTLSCFILPLNVKLLLDVAPQETYGALFLSELVLVV